MNKINFHYLVKNFQLNKRNELKKFLHRLMIKEGGKSIEAINYIFCSDDYLLEINKSFLNHDNYTDIITFELSSPDQPLLADIYISIERLKDNSTALSTSFKEELHRVLFHGALHLCGYKDKTKKDKIKMTEMENHYLNSYYSKLRMSRST